MMGTVEWSLAADELTRLSVTCPKCDTVATYDMTTEFGATEICCGRCGGNPMPGVKRLLVAYREFYRLLTDHAEGTIRFRLPAPKEPLSR
jgi:hypothetical protein